MAWLPCDREHDWSPVWKTNDCQGHQQETYLEKSFYRSAQVHEGARLATQLSLGCASFAPWDSSCNFERRLLQQWGEGNRFQEVLSEESWVASHAGKREWGRECRKLALKEHRDHQSERILSISCLEDLNDEQVSIWKQVTTPVHCKA